MVTPRSVSTADESSDRLHRFYLRDASVAYRDYDLWLPRSISETPAILGGLVLETSTEPIYLYRKTRNHLVIPRHFPWEGNVVEVTRQYERVHFDDGVVLRDNQREAWASLKSASNGVLALACGKGKTVLALKKIAQAGVPALVIVNLVGTIQQWAEQARLHLGEEVGIVWQKRREWDKKIVVASLETIAGQPNELPLELRDRFGIIIYDEVHHYSAKTFRKVTNLFSGARFGLTATVERADGTETVYLYHIGKVFFSDLSQELKPRVYFQQLPTKIDLNGPRVTDVTRELNVSKLRVFVSTLEERNRLVVDHLMRAKALGRNILLLGDSVDGLSMLYHMLGPDVSALVIGKVKGQKRLDLFRSGKIILASMGVAAEALDAPHLDTLFYLTPVKANRLVVQTIGRILRQHDNKASPMAVIFEDVNIPIFRGMCRSMRRSFTSKGYDCEVIYDEQRQVTRAARPQR